MFLLKTLQRLIFSLRLIKRSCEVKDGCHSYTVVSLCKHKNVFNSGTVHEVKFRVVVAESSSQQVLRVQIDCTRLLLKMLVLTILFKFVMKISCASIHP